jgi:hypothetical protein
MNFEFVNLENMIPPQVLEMVSPKIGIRILSDIADAARNEWISIASRELQTSRQDYITGIQPVKLDEYKGVATISLVGVLANLIEVGMDATDLHNTLLGPDVPISPPGSYGKHLTVKDDGSFGYYRAIPFRHATPGAAGVSGAPMGSAYDGHEAVADAKKLGKKVYELAQGLSASTSDPYGYNTEYGGRLTSPRDVETGERLPIAPLLKSHHKTNIYEGMIREEKTYQNATQSQYMTFRTISTGSPGWLRPQTQGRHFAEKVNQYVQQTAPQAFHAYVEGLG